MRPRDAERARQLSGSIRFEIRSDATHRLDRANEHRVTPPLAQRDDVEAVVHSINQKNVSMPRRTEERARALREAEARMARGVVGAAVGLGFDDARDPRFSSDSYDETRADERARNDASVALEERSRQRPFEIRAR